MYTGINQVNGWYAVGAKFIDGGGVFIDKQEEEARMIHMVTG